MGAIPGSPSEHHLCLPGVFYSCPNAGAASGGHCKKWRTGDLGRKDRGMRQDHYIGPVTIRIDKTSYSAAGRRAVRLRKTAEHHKISPDYT